MGEVKKGIEFINDAEQLAQKTQIKPNDDDLGFNRFINSVDSAFEVYIFANYDICNFTRYKKNHNNWTTLLQKFIYSGVNSATEWPMQFWKFNGDSITYRKKIQSIDELFRFVKKAYVRLKKFEMDLNDDNKKSKTICIRGAIWVSAFANGDNNEYNVNNATFQKNQFGKEFVGENIDEGFRLSACSKASNLAVDPKIVYMLTLYCNLISGVEKSCPLGFCNTELQALLNSKIDLDSEDKATKDAFKDLIDTVDKFYLMEFQKCKGVWNDRLYPVFWYVDDFSSINFLYDDIVAGKMLIEHDINIEDINDRKSTFEKKRDEIFKICYQVGIVDSITDMLLNLSFFPVNPSSGEFVFDTAKLYYNIALVVTRNGVNEGVLILKRKNTRHHLKNVWDLIPAKHARFKIINSNVIEEYLKQMIINELNMSEHNLKDNIKIQTDKKRRSVKPWAFCNIYRNGEIHNGILCVAYLDICDKTIESFLSEIKTCLVNDNNSKYSDVKLVTHSDVNLCIEDNDYDYFTVDGIRIRTLSLEEVAANSNDVYNNSDYVSNFDVIDKEDEFAISFLGYSIRQILNDFHT